MVEYIQRDDIENDKNAITQMLLKQYEVCVNKYQMHDDLIWKIPSVTVTIDGAVATLIFTTFNNVNNVNSQIASLAILFVTGFFTLTMILSLFKKRYFQYNLIQRMNQIEDFFNVTKMPMFTISLEKKEFMNEMVENKRFTRSCVNDLNTQNERVLLNIIAEKNIN